MRTILFHKYEIRQLLGEGSTGRVYLANDLHLNRLAAIKESVENAAEENGYEKEAEILKNLHHPGLPEIYDYCRQQGRNYLVMEYIEGISLRKYLDQNKKVGQHQAVEWMLQLTGILKYLHNCRPAIIYRDLKPANIIVCPDGRIKLIDLGAAIRFAAGKEKEYYCAGTPGYCPAGQWKEGYADARWDIYGVGAILHEMLTGVNPTLPPYERRRLREYDSSLSPGLESLIEVCTISWEAKRRGLKRHFFAGKQIVTMEQLEESLGCYTKHGQQNNLWWRLRQIPVYGMAGISGLWFALPLLHGVPDKDIPFPFLYRPLMGVLICVLLYRVLIHRKRGKGKMKKLEKSLCLTEKKYPGLFLLLVAVGVWGMTQWGRNPTSEQALAERGGAWTMAYAREENGLWVEMRDEQYRKLLLQDGAVYETDTQVRFELPAGRLPDGKLSLQIVAVGEGGKIYTSRTFLLKKKG